MRNRSEMFSSEQLSKKQVPQCLGSSQLELPQRRGSLGISVGPCSPTVCSRVRMGGRSLRQRSVSAADPFDLPCASSSVCGVRVSWALKPGFEALCVSGVRFGDKSDVGSLHAVLGRVAVLSFRDDTVRE